MSDPLSLPATAQPRPSGDSPWWLLGLLALIGWQAWLTLGLFDAGRSWRRIVDPEPIVSGRHPLHLYHGYLGARALWGRLSLSCYDPAFYAGYPKTPVFDPGSRPAEAALAAVGGAYQPEAYKTAVAVVCLLVPWILYLAARWTGAVRGVAVLAALLAVLVWWGRPGRSAVEAGDVDLLLATLMTLATAGLLIRYHRDPDVRGLLGITAGGAIAWFAHPLLCLLAAPLFLLYYLTIGPKHRLAWHTPLFLALFAAVGANAFWLGDWVSYWWIRVPPCRDVSLLTGRTVRAFWEAPLWGSGEDRVVAVLLIAASVVGTALLERAGCRATGRMFGAGVVGLLALAVAGVSCEPFARLGACHLLPTALLFAVVPAALTLARLGSRLNRWTRLPVASAVVLVCLPAAFGLAYHDPSRAWLRHLVEPQPLRIGLDADHLALLNTLREHTSDRARVLWEDRRGPAAASRWTALLPLLTERVYLGGLDPDGSIEHASTALVDGRLAGRPVAEWTDAELTDHARRYNLGWVVAWTAESRARLNRWPGAAGGPPLPPIDGEQPTLFTLRRTPSYVLTGTARWISADTRGVLLADAVGEPVPGEDERQIVLSLHHQAGMRVRPGRVRLERAVDPQDAIPFVRLRLREPVGRVFITWEGR